MRHLKRRTTKSRGRFQAVRRRLGLLLAVVLVLGACGGDDGGSPAEVERPTRVSLLVGNPSLFPFYESYIADAEGFFEERNLAVEVTPVEGTEGLIQGLASGLGDIIYGDMGSFLRPAAAEQFHPVAFYMVTNTGVFDIVVPADSDVQEPGDLDGGVIGANSEEDPGAALAQAFMNATGADAELTFVGSPPQAIAAFERGDIDAYAGSIPDLAVMRARGLDLRSIAPVELRAGAGGSGFWAEQDYVEANPDVLRAFSDAITEAHELVGDDPERLVAIAEELDPVQVEERDVALALAEGIIDLRPTDVEPVGNIDPEVWNTWWNGLAENGVIDPDTLGNPEDFFTNEFVTG